MNKRYFIAALSECVRKIHRELRVAVTPVPQNKQWVFIVGCYNSGTTLLDKLLSFHPDVSALPTEGHFITDQFIKDYDIGLPRMWVDREDLFRLIDGHPKPDVMRIKKEWAARLDRSKKVFLEKSPPNSARTIWLQEKFENAKFIVITRDPYAVSEGIRRKAKPFHTPEGWPIEKCAYQWARTYEILMEDAEYLKHCKWIKYEDLCDKSDSILNEVFNFIGLRKHDISEKNDALSIHERKSSIRNMNKESFERLTHSDIRKISDVVSPIAGKLGYEVL